MRTGQHLSTLRTFDLKQTDSEMTCNLQLTRFEPGFRDSGEINQIDIDWYPKA
jgi:hypothetical protein